MKHFIFLPLPSEFCFVFFNIFLLRIVSAFFALLLSHPGLFYVTRKDSSLFRILYIVSIVLTSSSRYFAEFCCKENLSVISVPQNLNPFKFPIILFMMNLGNRAYFRLPVLGGFTRFDVWRIQKTQN